MSNLIAVTDVTPAAPIGWDFRIFDPFGDVLATTTVHSVADAHRLIGEIELNDATYESDFDTDPCIALNADKYDDDVPF